MMIAANFNACGKNEAIKKVGVCVCNRSLDRYCGEATDVLPGRIAAIEVKLIKTNVRIDFTIARIWEASLRED